MRADESSFAEFSNQY